MMSLDRHALAVAISTAHGALHRSVMYHLRVQHVRVCD